jgi:hypothetical protein
MPPNKNKMEKRASNTFVAGLNSDRHPLTAQNTELIEARNVDLIAVGEGYQLILQKREGNLEVLIIPPAYEATKVYYIGEYVLSNNLAYKSLQDLQSGHAPAVSPAFWEALTTNTVPAGLKEGFIPLAVKEFNNIAYIVSVKPNADPTKAGIGELGTFPSPDYDLFKYEEGAIQLASAAISAGVYDANAVPSQYGYTFAYAGPVPEGTPWPIDINTSDSDPTIGSSIFVITHTGYMPDTYTFDVTDKVPYNFHIFYSIDNSGIYINFFDAPHSGAPILLNQGQTMSAVVSCYDPWFMNALIANKLAATVSVIPDPLHGSPTTGLDFEFYTNPAISIKKDVPGSVWGFSEFDLDLGGSAGNASYLLRTNLVGATYTIPAGLQPFVMDGDNAQWFTITTPAVGFRAFVAFPAAGPGLAQSTVTLPLDTNRNSWPAATDPWVSVPGGELAGTYAAIPPYTDGYLWKCFLNTDAPSTSPDGDTLHWKQMLFTYQSSWSAGTQYRRGMTVQYIPNSFYYTCLQDHIGSSDPVLIPDAFASTYWQELAQYPQTRSGFFYIQLDGGPFIYFYAIQES